jgi:hypothetical protein
MLLSCASCFGRCSCRTLGVPMKQPEDWAEYEKTIVDHFRAQFPDAAITQNAHVMGRFSR